MGSRVPVCALACLLVALGINAVAGETVTVGVNVVNPQRLSAGDRQALLDQLQTAGVRVIRAPLSPAWDGDDYGPATDFIRRASERGIKADLIVGLQYREGAQRRPAVKDLPAMWPSFPFSVADPERFRAVFKPLFERLETTGMTFAALELGNEINWTAFNGDFPIPGEGRVFGEADLTRDPEAIRIAEGYRAYLRTLGVLKDIRDHSRLNRGTPILSAGLSDPGPAGSRPGSKTDAVTIGATLQYLRANGLDALVDAYGVHTYPVAKASAQRLKTAGRGYAGGVSAAWPGKAVLAHRMGAARCWRCMSWRRWPASRADAGNACRLRTIRPARPAEGDDLLRLE